MKGNRQFQSAGGAILLIICLLSFALQGAAFQSEEETDSIEYGIFSVLPAVTAILLAFVTGEVLLSLFMGIVVGGVVSGDWNILQKFLIPAIGSRQYGLILLVYLWCLGGLIGIWTRTGGAQAFAEWSARYLVRGRCSAKLFAWVMGIVFHQGGTISTVLTGTTVRPVADREGVSHEELSYIVDSTASPVAGLIPFNIWPVYIGGLAAGSIPLIPDQGTGITFFYQAIPLNFYAIFALGMTFLFSLDLLPWTGRKMALAVERVKSTGATDAPGSSPLVSRELSEVRVPSGYRPSPLDFIVPMLVLIGFAVGSYAMAGSVKIAEAFALSMLTGFLLARVRGLKFSQIISGFVDGCKGMTSGAVLLGLALTLGQVSKELQTASWLVENVSTWVTPLALPAILLGLCIVVSFSIGTSFGTFAVVIPMALPLAWSLSPDPDYIKLCFASVVGGALFGDQCSPISDTTILSSLACGADLMDHVTTQIPLALVAASLAGVCGAIAAWMIL